MGSRSRQLAAEGPLLRTSSFYPKHKPKKNFKLYEISF